MTRRQPLVTVVVLSYNSAKHVSACVESVLAQTFPSVELIIVDNASTDESPQVASQAIQGVGHATLIQNARNEGFARGMNIGARAGSGEWVLFLNADAVLASDYVEKSLSAVDRVEGKVGMVGGRVFRWADGVRTDEHACGGLALGRRFSLVAAGNPGLEQLVFGPAGCCPLVRAEMLYDVALANGDYYDGDYFMYHEDTDLWFRGHLRGWNCLYVPSAVAWHVHAASYGGKRRTIDRPLIAQRRAFRNRWLTIFKVLPAGMLLRLSPFLAATEVLAFLFLLTRSPASLIARGRATADFISALPRTLKKRRYIQSRASVAASSLSELLRGY
jgi:GT2 family glycosyltransferase